MPRPHPAPALLAVIFCFCATSLYAQPTIANGSFETPNLGACPNLVVAPPGSSWTFVNSAGITSTGCNLLFAIVPPPPGGGQQEAFLQAGSESAGVISSVNTAAVTQTVTGFEAGHSYTISFYAAGHAEGVNCNDNCTELNFSVMVGSTDVLDVSNPPTAAFQQYTTGSFTASGSAEIGFFGSAPTGVNAISFIDLVSIQDLGLSSLPSIGSGGVVSASAFGEFTSAAPGTWIEIYGTNLATETASWTGADFNGINAPTSLDGTYVTIAGIQAFVDFISPGQVNALIPSNVPTGQQQLTVTTPAGTSAPYNLTINAVEPGLLAPPNFNVGGTQYVVAQFANGTYALPTGAIAGLTSRPAEAGDILVIYGVGFGPVTPDIPAGQLVQEANTLASDFSISIGGVQCQVEYDGLAPGYTGLYQLNVVVPSGIPSGPAPLTLTVDGVSGTQTLLVAIE